MLINVLGLKGLNTRIVCSTSFALCNKMTSEATICLLRTRVEDLFSVTENTILILINKVDNFFPDEKWCMMQS